MDGKVKCIVKRTDEVYGHMTNISASLENLQRTIGGYIEPIYIGDVKKDGKDYDIVVICDEEGKLKGKEPNIVLGQDVICGDIIVIGAYREDFCDVPITFEAWKDVIRRWGPCF